MGAKLIYIDIGELGWSLILSAHLRWLHDNTETTIAAMVFPDRRCLYKDFVELMIDVPQDFYVKFKGFEPCFMGLFDTKKSKQLEDSILKEYFIPQLPDGYTLAPGFTFGYGRFFKSRLTFAPYGYSEKLEGEAEILIFPRCKSERHFAVRNLPKKFYIRLVERLCDAFPEHKVRTMGITSGTYDIREVNRINYKNSVKEKSDLQSLIDRCQLATVAVGSQSAPVKISLLQRVPTFIMGHQRTRHVRLDNWMGTKAGFYETGDYTNFIFTDCIDRIVSFIGECQ